MDGLTIIRVAVGAVSALTGIGALLIAILTYRRQTKTAAREHAKTEPLPKAWDEDDLRNLGQTCREEMER